MARQPTAADHQRARAISTGRDWYQILNRTDASGTSYAEVLLYDEIGYYGITAGQFVAELGGLDVAEIDLHINSPGGEVWDGIAIYNALVTHKARITTYDDGIAASAASVIFMAGDSRVMAQGSQLMIHDAWGLCAGNAADMTEMAARLNQESDNIAGFYANRSGGTVASWRKAMLAETWYSADEAVAVGLADKVAKRATPGENPAARWDLKVYGYRYAGRAEAPAPTEIVPPVAVTDPPADPPPTEPADPPPPSPEATTPGSLGEALSPIDFAGALAGATATPDYTIDPGLFRAALGQAVQQVPAVETAPAVTIPPSTGTLVDAFSNAFREAFRT